MPVDWSSESTSNSFTAQSLQVGISLIDMNMSLSAIGCYDSPNK